MSANPYQVVIEEEWPVVSVELVDADGVLCAGAFAICDSHYLGCARVRQLWSLPNVPSEAVWDMLAQGADRLKLRGQHLLRAITNPPLFVKVYQPRGWSDSGQREQFGGREVWIMEYNLEGDNALWTRQ